MGQGDQLFLVCLDFPGLIAESLTSPEAPQSWESLLSSLEPVVTFSRLNKQALFCPLHPLKFCLGTYKSLCKLDIILPEG